MTYWPFMNEQSVIVKLLQNRLTLIVTNVLVLGYDILPIAFVLWPIMLSMKKWKILCSQKQ